MRITAVVLSLVWCCSYAGAQSLDELAKKEKERRKANAEAGKTAVVEADGGPPEGPKKKVPYEPLKQDPKPMTLDEAIEELEERVPEMHEDWERERDRCQADSERLGGSKSSLATCEKADELFRKYRDASDALSKLKRQRFWIRYNNGEIEPKKKN